MQEKQCVWEGVWKSEGGLRWNSKVCMAPKITARPSYPTLEFFGAVRTPAWIEARRRKQL